MPCICIYSPLNASFSSSFPVNSHQIQKNFYNKISEPSDEENDMLDLAYELKEK